VSVHVIERSSRAEWASTLADVRGTEFLASYLPLVEQHAAGA
jgi:hypothetical protein